MAITNYTELKAAVSDWFDRDDIDTTVAQCIALAESRITTALQARALDAIGSISTAAGIESVTLPVNFQRMRALSVPLLGLTLDYVTPEQFGRLTYPGGTGQPRSYTISGDQLYLAPVPDRVYSLRAVYGSRVVPLTDAAPTNAVLTKWPDLYLWGALAEACIYSRDTEFFPVCEGRFNAAVAAINNNDWSAAGTLTVRADTGA